MADREFRTPIPRLAEVPFGMLAATRKWERIALKWRALAEGRRDHHLDLYKSGRWKHYYTDAEFLVEMRQAVTIAERWEAIAPLPEEREAATADARPSQAAA
jgi:uncharacterized repeat protein (TIGR03809 family)